MGEDRARYDRSREHEQETPPQPLGGIQGQGGAGGRQGRQDGGRDRAASTTCTPTRSTEWRRQLLERAADVFGGAAAPSEPPVDLKALHAKIGQLALENDFLEGALTKAGMLSAKR